MKEKGKKGYNISYKSKKGAISTLCYGILIENLVFKELSSSTIACLSVRNSIVVEYLPTGWFVD